MKWILCIIVATGLSCIELKGDLGSKKIIATTGMVADLVSRIAGPEFQVETLMGQGIDPHSYKASAQDLRRLTEASIIVYSGVHLEAKMGEVFEKLAPHRPVFSLAENIPKSTLIDAGHGQFDPHIWFDPILWLSCGETVVKKLSEYYPELGPAFQKRFEETKKEFVALDEEIRVILAKIPDEKRVLVTAHDAFNYFGRRYSFGVEGIQGISTASEAGTSDIQRVAHFLVQKGIKTVFVETSVSDRTMRALSEACKDLGHEVGIGEGLFSDSMGDPASPEGNYPGMVRHNARAIARGLEK